MASMTILAPSGAQSQSREWITPQEQLNRLINYNAQSIAYPISQTSICPDSYNQETKSSIANIISQYAVETLSPKLTNWHKALQRIGALPNKVPALPWNMPQILDGKCPIHSNKKKLDGTHYKLSDTHLLYLIPDGTLNELEARVRAYGEQALNDQGERLYPRENPLQFRYFLYEARWKHGNVRSNECQWLLISNDVLPQSRNKPYDDQQESPNKPYDNQVQTIEELTAKSFINYEIPSLYAAVASCFLHKVATGESLYQRGNEENGNIHTYTRVKETTETYRMIVGGYDPSGVYVDRHFAYAHDYIGVAALRKL